MDYLNKQEVIGLPIEEPFAPGCIFYPGHNQSGFQIDDEEIEELLIDEYKNFGDQTGHTVRNIDEVAQVISTTVFRYSYLDVHREAVAKQLCEEDFFRLINEREVWMDDFRQRFFYEENEPQIINIREYRCGIACTEKAAIAHNLFCAAEIQNWYYVGYYVRMVGCAITHQSNRHCCVVYRDKKALKICDPASGIITELPIKINRRGMACAHYYDMLGQHISLYYCINPEALSMMRK